MNQYSTAANVARERRRISGCHWLFGGDNRQLEIRLRSQATANGKAARNILFRLSTYSHRGQLTVR